MSDHNTPGELCSEVSGLQLQQPPHELDQQHCEEPLMRRLQCPAHASCAAVSAAAYDAIQPAQHALLSPGNMRTLCAHHSVKGL